MSVTVESFIGVSDATKTIRSEIEYAARSDAKVLLTGESGVGKEVAGRLIHALSSRSRMPFVPINCVGLPESLLESELFGHVRGSFTGAYRDRLGLLQAANRGTVFLDEVCEMGPRMQGILLRFLESGEVQPVGADRVQRDLDVRVIAATNRSPAELVAAKTFREDLYYRLNVIEIVIPPLRVRRQDIPVLFEHFLRLYGEQYGIAPPEIAADARMAMVEYDWPGNVRQLKNVVERLVVRNRSIITAAELPRRAGGSAGAPVAFVGESVVQTMFERMVKQGESFWSVVYTPYMGRDLTRRDLRDIITRGLQETSGSYKMLVQLFNMQQSDYKRLLNFLRKQGCQVPFAGFRSVQPWHRQAGDSSLREAVAAVKTQLRH